MSTKIITIAQQKGGAGKTTISAHLAVAFAKKGQKVAVIDIDPQASLSTWARIRAEKLGNKNDIYSVASNAYGLNAEIEKLQGKADIIIVDSPPHIETEARNAIRAADLVILPVQPSPTDLWATKASLEITKQENIPAKILLNRISLSSTLGKTIRSVFEATAPEFLLKGQLGNRVAFPASMLDGLTAIEISASSPAAKEVEELINEINIIIGNKNISVAKPAVKNTQAKAKKKTVIKKKAVKKPSVKSEAPKKPVAKKKATAKKAAIKKPAAKKQAKAKPASNVTKLPLPKKPIIKDAVVKKAKPKRKLISKKNATAKKNA